MTGVVVLGMLTWWQPGYRTWGALALALLVACALWLMWRTILGDRSVPGNPVYLALLGPAAMLTYHLSITGLGPEPAEAAGLAGAINISMIFQIALLAGGVMLTQSFLPRAIGYGMVLRICGAAMMGGAAAAIVWGQAGPVRSALAMLGFAGIGVWLLPLWGAATGGRGAGVSQLRRREMRLGCVGVAIVAAVLLGLRAPREAAVAAGVVAWTLIVGGLVFRPGRGWMRAVMIPVVVGAVLVLLFKLLGGPLLAFELGPQPLIGIGEKAFTEVSAAETGLVVLVRTVGWAATLWLVGGLLLCILWLLWRGRNAEPAARPGALVWTATAVLAGCALLGRGGLFIPAVTLGAAFTWGLLPAMLGCSSRSRPGWILLAMLISLMLLLGLARKGGLAVWSAEAFGTGEVFLHAAGGFGLAMVLAWLMGGRKVWLGLLGIFVAALLGGAGELLQGVASRRGVEFTDWLAHAVGSGIAVLPYLLCIGARWCESPDARDNPPDTGSPLWRQTRREGLDA